MKISNGSKEMTPSNRPDKANDLEAARKKIELRKAENINSLGNKNGSIGGNIAVGGK